MAKKICNIAFKILAIMLALSLLPTSSFAGGDTKATTTSTTTTLGLVTFQVDTEKEENLTMQIEKAAVELGIDLKKVNINLTAFVIGDNLDLLEKSSLAYAQNRAPEITKNLIPASWVSFEDVDNSTNLFVTLGLPVERPLSEGGGNGGGAVKSIVQLSPKERIIVLVGGPSQNRITREFYDRGMLSEITVEISEFLAIPGRTSDGALIVVVSDARGFGNIERRATEYSPLALCLPLQWVPVAASIMGAVFVIIANIIKAYIETLIANRAKKKYSVNKDALRILGVKIREVFAIIGAALVLAFAISWTYAGPSVNIILLFFMNTLICLVGGLSHELVHWIFGRLLKIHTEYRFWPSGSVATIFTAFMGNSFGLQGFLVEEVEEGTPKWKTGIMKISSPIFSIGIMILFAIINLIHPSVVFQMIYSISGMLAMVDILPFNPMDGYDVRKWNIFIWLASFIFIAISFVTVSFIL